MSSLPRRPTMVSVNSPSLKSRSVGYRERHTAQGWWGSRPHSASQPSRGRRTPRPAHRRSGPAGGRDRTTPPRSPRARLPLRLIIEVAVSERLDLFGCHSLSPTLSVLTPAGRGVPPPAHRPRHTVVPTRPTKILTHPSPLDASPQGRLPNSASARIAALRAAPPACIHERETRALPVSGSTSNRVVQAARRPHDRIVHNAALHLIQAARLESGRHQEDVRTASIRCASPSSNPIRAADHRRVLRGQIAPQSS